MSGLGRSRKGAWIEIKKVLGRILKITVAPVRERGLKYRCKQETSLSLKVAPVRERGLKSVPMSLAM